MDLKDHTHRHIYVRAGFQACRLNIHGALADYLFQLILMRGRIIYVQCVNADPCHLDILLTRKFWSHIKLEMVGVAQKISNIVWLLTHSITCQTVLISWQKTGRGLLDRWTLPSQWTCHSGCGWRNRLNAKKKRRLVIRFLNNSGPFSVRLIHIHNYVENGYQK